MTTRRVSLLGATGLVGDRTLDVIGRGPERFAVVALAACRQPMSGPSPLQQPREAIEVVVDPESVIHSLVEYVDGRVLAQLRNPDVRTPIAAACAETLARVPARPVRALDDALAADAEARAVARARLKLPAPSSPLAA